MSCAGAGHSMLSLYGEFSIPGCVQAAINTITIATSKTLMLSSLSCSPSVGPLGTRVKSLYSTSSRCDTLDLFQSHHKKENPDA